MSDWAVGDLALCIKLSPWVLVWTCGKETPATGPKPGSINRVSRIGREPLNGLVLWFEGWPQVGMAEAFDATRFRRIPPHTPDRNDFETIYELSRERVPALGES